jgi:hypothetical protein
MFNSLFFTIVDKHFVSNVRWEKNVGWFLEEQIPSQHLVILEYDFVVEFFQLLDYIKTVFLRHLEVKDKDKHWPYGIWAGRLESLIH